MCCTRRYLRLVLFVAEDVQAGIAGEMIIIPGNSLTGIFPMSLTLQPLRVPSGWEIRWNIFYETELNQEAVDSGLFLDARLLFWAVHPKRRFGLSMEWRRKPEPVGQFYLDVLYSPRQLTPQGRQYKGSSLDFAPEPVHQFETQSQSAMVREIEEWLERCVELVHGPVRA